MEIKFENKNLIAFELDDMNIEFIKSQCEELNLSQSQYLNLLLRTKHFETFNFDSFRKLNDLTKQ